MENHGARMSDLKAPWTPKQVIALNDYQQSDEGHPFTCANRGPGHAPTNSYRDVLVATVNGWICPFCDYTQDWAHPFMAMTGADIEKQFNEIAEALDTSAKDSTASPRLRETVTTVIAAHPHRVEDWFAGRPETVGYFVGEVMSATQRNPYLAGDVQREVRRQLESEELKHWSEKTGLNVASVEHVGIAPLVNGTCHFCDEPCQFVFVSWCDDCLQKAVEWADENKSHISKWCRMFPDHVAAKHPEK